MRVVWPDAPHVAGDPFADIFCLADIENFVIGADHPVDARADRRMFPKLPDDRRAMQELAGVFVVHGGLIEIGTIIRLICG